MSASEETATPHVPNSPSACGIVVVVAVEGRHVVGDRQPGAAGGQQLLEALVGLLGVAEAREHAHRPQPAAMPGRVDAAREWRLAGEAKVVDLVPSDGGSPSSGLRKR